MWRVEVIRYTPEGDHKSVPVACRSRRHAVNIYKGFVDYMKVPGAVYLVSPEGDDIGKYIVETY